VEGLVENTSSSASGPTTTTTIRLPPWKLLPLAKRQAAQPQPPNSSGSSAPSVAPRRPGHVKTKSSSAIPTLSTTAHSNNLTRSGPVQSGGMAVSHDLQIHAPHPQGGQHTTAADLLRQVITHGYVQLRCIFFSPSFLSTFALKSITPCWLWTDCCSPRSLVCTCSALIPAPPKPALSRRHQQSAWNKARAQQRLIAGQRLG
jgi:hypothetical protein